MVDMKYIDAVIFIKTPREIFLRIYYPLPKMIFQF